MSQPKRVVLLGAVLVGAGSLMPWAKVHTAFGTMTLSGTDGDGVITLLLAGILLLIGLFRTSKPGHTYSVLGVLIAVVAFIISVSALTRIGGLAAENTSEYVATNVGSGIYIVLLGSAIGGIGSLLKVVGADPELGPALPEQTESTKSTTDRVA